MLWTPRAPGLAWRARIGRGPDTGAEMVLSEARKLVRKYGRLARSDEHSSGVAIPGSESGHALQVRGRTKNSRLQTGQPLALQEIEAGSVDGREVEPDGDGYEA